jgi:hypothetical protein
MEAPVSAVDGYSGIATTKHIVLGGTPELHPLQPGSATVEYSDFGTNMAKSSRRILSTITRDGELLKYNARPAGSGNYHQPIAVVKLPQP